MTLACARCTPGADCSTADAMPPAGRARRHERVMAPTRPHPAALASHKRDSRHRRRRSSVSYAPPFASQEVRASRHSPTPWPAGCVSALQLSAHMLCHMPRAASERFLLRPPISEMHFASIPGSAGAVIAALDASFGGPTAPCLWHRARRHHAHRRRAHRRRAYRCLADVRPKPLVAHRLPRPFARIPSAGEHTVSPCRWLHARESRAREHSA